VVEESTLKDPRQPNLGAVQKEFVAFEVDWVEPTWKIGWSVVVRGQARVVTDHSEFDRLGRLELLPWADGEKGAFVRIEMELISGRRLKE